MSLKFINSECPYCKHSQKVLLRLKGKLSNCKKCGKKYKVNEVQARQTAQTKQANIKTPSKRVTSRINKRRLDRSKGTKWVLPVIVIGLILACSGLSFAFLFKPAPKATLKAQYSYNSGKRHSSKPKTVHEKTEQNAANEAKTTKTAKETKKVFPPKNPSSYKSTEGNEEETFVETDIFSPQEDSTPTVSEDSGEKNEAKVPEDTSDSMEEDEGTVLTATSSERTKTREEKAWELLEAEEKYFEEKEWDASYAACKELLSRYEYIKAVKEKKKKIESDLETSQKYLGKFEISDKEVLGKGCKYLGKSRYRLSFRFKDKDLKEELVAWSNVEALEEDGKVEDEKSRYDYPARIEDGALAVSSSQGYGLAYITVPFAGRNISVECTAWTEDSTSRAMILGLIKADNLTDGYIAELNEKLYVGDPKLYHGISFIKGGKRKWYNEKTKPRIAPEQKVRIRFEVKGDCVNLYVNNSRVSHFKDRKNSRHFVNWMVAIGALNSLVYFDDIIITGYLRRDAITRAKNDIKTMWRFKGALEREKSLYGDRTEHIKGLSNMLASTTSAALTAINEGTMNFNAGHYDQAIKAYTTAIDADPNMAYAYYSRGQCYMLKKQMDEALQDVDQAIRIKDDFCEARLLRGDIFLWKDQYDDAVAAFEETLTIDGDNPDAYISLAKAYFYQGHIDTAIATLEKAPENRKVKRYYKSLLVNKTGPQWEKKYVKESKHYIVMSNISQKFTKEMSARLEQMFAEYSRNFPPPKYVLDKKSRVIIFESQLQYMEYTYLTRDYISTSTAGFYSPILKELVLFDDYDPKETIDTLYHEGFHQFLDLFIKKAPIAFNEGMAEYFGPSKIVKGRLVTGMVNRRLPIIQECIKSNKYVPLEKLLNYSKLQYYENANICYAQGWSLMYFLIHGQHGKYRKKFKKYFNALYREKSKEEAFREGFGDVKWRKLTKEWRRYILSLKLGS